MKKFLLPLTLVAVIAVGGYFLFFEEGNGEEENGENEVERVDADSLKPAESYSEEDLRRQQRLDEHARPQDFVVLNYESRRNLLGDAVIEGSFANEAELTRYRDLQVKIYFEDEEGKLLDSAAQTVFEAIAPGEEVEFRLKEKQPKRTSVRLRVERAVAEDVE